MLRVAVVGGLAFSLAACASETDTAAPLSDVDNTEVVAAPAEIPAGTYALDATHSDVGFRVRHLGISNVDGSFSDVDGTITIPAAGIEGMEAEVTVQVNSIDTRNDDRDGHLQSEDFFAAEQYPTLTFRTTSVDALGGNRFRMTGDLTIRGVTKPVTLEGEYIGTASVRGTQKIGFEASGEITRQEWGLSWAQTNEAGEALVGDTVTLVLNVEADLREEDAAEEEAAEEVSA